MKPETEIKLGTKVYSYKTFTGIFEYICTEVRESKDNTLYVFECQACSHGYKCLVLLRKNRRSNTFSYVETLNDDAEDDDQEHWHSGDKYFLKKIDCKKARAKESVKFYQDKIERCKETIKSCEDSLSEIEAWIK